MTETVTYRCSRPGRRKTERRVHTMRARRQVGYAGWMPRMESAVGRREDQMVFYGRSTPDRSRYLRSEVRDLPRQGHVRVGRALHLAWYHEDRHSQSHLRGLDRSNSGRARGTPDQGHDHGLGLIVIFALERRPGRCPAESMLCRRACPIPQHDGTQVVLLDQPTASAVPAPQLRSEAALTPAGVTPNADENRARCRSGRSRGPGAPSQSAGVQGHGRSTAACGRTPWHEPMPALRTPQRHTRPSAVHR
ncbi:hypothetical protein F4558_001213 [Micromonospora profundi]|nr:hypothetical protein [Micromonospora profundi]